MQILLRRLGQHRGAPRLYLDTQALASAGLLPGTAVKLELRTDEFRLTIRADAQGTRRVSSKRRSGRLLPVIDVNSREDLAPFAECGVVRIVIVSDAVHILLPASVIKAMARSARLAARLALGQPLTTAGLAFGAGIASRALHDGLSAGGVASRLVLANEICEDYLGLAETRNPVVRADTAIAAVPMQEAAQDGWLLSRLALVDILEAGIPCSGASKAGVSKRKLTKMEDHPTVGHLIGAAIQLIGTLQPAIVLIENVESYRDTASAAILRGWLRDAGYAVAETVLDASDFGSLEARVRWFLVAYPPELPLDLSDLAALAPVRAGSGSLADVLEPIGPDDARFRRVDYLKTKQERDASKGSHFAMQWLTPQSQSVPVLRKGYHKGGSTDPRLLHPSDHERSRLLTSVEHARIKGIDPALIAEAQEALAHQVCGQAVDVRPVHAIGERIAQVLQASRAGVVSQAATARPPASCLAEIAG